MNGIDLLDNMLAGKPSQVVVGSLARSDDYQRILTQLKAIGDGPVTGEMVDRILDNGECLLCQLSSLTNKELPPSPLPLSLSTSSFLYHSPLPSPELSPHRRPS